MTDPVKWKAGMADEAWKVMICARDAMRATDLIQGVAYILDNPGQCDVVENAKILRRFSGEQIADALLDYRKSAMESVDRGMRKHEVADTAYPPPD